MIFPSELDEIITEWRWVYSTVQALKQAKLDFPCMSLATAKAMDEKLMVQQLELDQINQILIDHFYDLPISKVMHEILYTNQPKRIYK